MMCTTSAMVAADNVGTPSSRSSTSRPRYRASFVPRSSPTHPCASMRVIADMRQVAHFGSQWVFHSDPFLAAVIFSTPLAAA